MSKKQNEEAWDTLSEHYQGSRRISLENYHYGAYAPGENELGMIGDVSGLDVLEIGCGGGQNSIVLKKQGARSVLGIDQSENQLKHAIELADNLGIEVQFKKYDMEDLSEFNDGSVDLIVSSHAMNYAMDLQRVFGECDRLLRPGGRMVTCISHPLWIVLGEALELDDFSKIVNYFEGIDDVWDWEGYEGKKIATFHSKSWRLEHIINGLINAGFSIDRVAEPRGYSEEELTELPLDAVPYRDIPNENKGFIRGNRIIPSALIISVTKKA
ncbi:MAG: class I SAM-dependent methyltransferase [Candidatus Thorarchaeota archaeon]